MINPLFFNTFPHCDGDSKHRVLIRGYCDAVDVSASLRCRMSRQKHAKEQIFVLHVLRYMSKLFFPFSVCILWFHPASPSCSTTFSSLHCFLEPHDQNNPFLSLPVVILFYFFIFKKKYIGTQRKTNHKKKKNIYKYLIFSPFCLHIKS